MCLHIDGLFKRNVLQVIGNGCKELEEFALDITATNASSLQPLQRIQSLKTLKLRDVSCDDLKLIPALTKLRELHLIDCRLPEDSNQLALLTQLTKLYINEKKKNCDWLPVLLDIIRRLTNLEELHFSIGKFWEEGFVLDEKIFSKIVSIVRGRPKVLTLKCDFDFNLKTCDENQKVRLIRPKHLFES